MEVVANPATGFNTDGRERMNNNPFTNSGRYEHMFIDKRLFVECLIGAIDDAETESTLTHLLVIGRSILSQTTEILLIQKLIEAKLELIKK